MKREEVIYNQIIDGLRLAASPFDVQKDVLPDFVHLPDEVLNAVEYVLVPQLIEVGLITEDQARAVKEYDEFLDTLEPMEDYEGALKQMEDGSWFQELREKATALLQLLGEVYQRPTLDGVVYVKGAQQKNAADR